MVCSGEPSSLGDNQIGDAGATDLADAVRINATLKILSQVRTLLFRPFSSFFAASPLFVHPSIRLTSPVRVLFAVCSGEYSSLSSNNIGDAGATSLADAVRVNATLTKL
jgi:hypothetical protein